MPKFLVTLEGHEPLLVETQEHNSSVNEVLRYVEYHFRRNAPKVLAVVPTHTDELPSLPEGCDWLVLYPERNGFHSMWKFVPVTEWWSPSFAGNFVAVQAHYIKSKDAVLLSVTGGDDTMCTLGYLPVDEALAIFNQIDEGTTKEELLNWGFEW